MTYCFVGPHLEPFSGLAMDAKICQLRFSKVTWPVWIIDSDNFDLLIWWLEKITNIFLPNDECNGDKPW